MVICISGFEHIIISSIYKHAFKESRMFCLGVAVVLSTPLIWTDGIIESSRCYHTISEDLTVAVGWLEGGWRVAV